jgi:hypothetical protein
MSEVVIPELNVPFTFRRRPVSLPPDLRPEWRVGIVLLTLRICCREYRASFARLHVLNWAVRTVPNQLAIAAVIAKESSPDALIVRIEPSLNRAVDLANGYRLIVRVAGDRIQLTNNGVNLADELQRQDNLYVPEREFFSQVGRKVTEKLVANLFAAYKGA